MLWLPFTCFLECLRFLLPIGCCLTFRWLECWWLEPAWMGTPTDGDHTWLMVTIQFNQADRSVIDKQRSRSACLQTCVVGEGPFDDISMSHKGGASAIGVICARTF